jgi:hypothetical protein
MFRVAYCKQRTQHACTGHAPEMGNGRSPACSTRTDACDCGGERNCSAEAAHPKTGYMYVGGEAGLRSDLPAAAATAPNLFGSRAFCLRYGRERGLSCSAVRS